MAFNENIVLSPSEILKRLVAFPTVSTETNLPLVDWVQNYLSGFGIVSHRMYDPTGQKANLYASIGPDLPGGVMLSGHTDVVPVEGQPWSTEPFVLTERDGRLYGRGTTDMKGFDALAIAAMVEAARVGLQRPLQLALSYDEELDCGGCAMMVPEIVATLPRAAAVIVGEPTSMKIVTGHKGGMAYHLDIRGRAVHSSMAHTGVSAIHEAGRLISWLNRMNAENEAHEHSFVAAQFEPPWTSLHCGLIHGGTASNITAQDLYMDFGFRLVPGDRRTPEEWDRLFRDEVARIEAGMQAIVPESRITVRERAQVPPLTTEESGVAEALLRGLTGDNTRSVVSYCTEAGLFQEGGYSAAVCGPGDIARAHKPDEYVTIAELDEGWQFMLRLVAGLSEDSLAALHHAERSVR